MKKGKRMNVRQTMALAPFHGQQIYFQAVPGRMNIRHLMVLALVLLVACIYSCSKEEVKSDETINTGTPVQVTHPLLQDFTEFVHLNANTVFLKKEIVRATFQGFIDKILLNIGDPVREGDVVLAIRTKESAADDSIHIPLGAAMFKGCVEIHAHSDGVLTALNYHSGDFVSEGEEIAIISNPSSLCITLNVPYSYISRISRNRSCDVLLPDGETAPAVIQKIIPSVDPVSQTQTFLLHLQRNVALPENLNVNVRLPLQTAKKAVVLPRNAVMSNETQDTFWIMQVVNDSTAVRVDVHKGIENDSLIQIVTPVLKPDDLVISEGAYGLPDSARVTIDKAHE
jgi:multidrug efflux pump subunit AcrA (membrane-fusion protein)